ncbi:hypothetical protein [Arthrobacter mobilis]|uniref:Uncharacterized protein n=1 Tax=Arthrobacter mobilis TaxID=2724944 RepID=A0A7X6K425_9MICC|nr:hypothetical protein [Arthrobacter mobilis]NKX54160.1 hypothetical protein [Arthrobacter mobilis]
MKTSATWRLWLIITGAVLGLLATMGVAAPATAAVAAHSSSYDHRDRDHDREWDDWDHGHDDDEDAELTLRIFRDGDYRIRGEDYDARRVHVWLVNVSRDRVVEHYRVRTDDGEFTIRDGEVRCGRTYKAVSFSRADGWEVSNKVSFRCHD